MGIPKPSAGHLKLHVLAGRWQGEETMYPSQWDPKGGKATGRNVSRMSLSDFVLISDYEQERNGIITYAGHGVFTYQPKDNTYSLHWYDSMGSPPEAFIGGLSGDILTLAHGGPGMHARMTYDLSEAPNLLATKMEMSPDGSSWQTLFDARYRKL